MEKGFFESRWIGFLRTVCSEFQHLSPKSKVLSQNHALEQQQWSWVGPDPVLKVNAHGAHVRGTKESWGDQKAGWLFLYLFSVKLAGLFSNKCIRTELEYMQLWREVIEHRSRASVVYLISNWGWKHKIRIFVACWMCRKLRAFWGDQTDPKFGWGGPNSILRTGTPSYIYKYCSRNTPLSRNESLFMTHRAK